MLIVTILSLTYFNQTPKNQFDYTINAKINISKKAIATVFLNNGYHKTEESFFKLAFDRPAKDSFAAELLSGTDFYHIANARVTLTFSGNNPTIITPRMSVVKNPASSFEQHLDVSNNNGGQEKIYAYIQQARDLAEKQ